MEADDPEIGVGAGDEVADSQHGRRAQEGGDGLVQQVEGDETKHHDEDGLGEEEGRIEDAGQDYVGDADVAAAVSTYKVISAGYLLASKALAGGAEARLVDLDGHRLRLNHRPRQRQLREVEAVGVGIGHLRLGAADQNPHLGLVHGGLLGVDHPPDDGQHYLGARREFTQGRPCPDQAETQDNQRGQPYSVADAHSRSPCAQTIRASTPVSASISAAKASSAAGTKAAPVLSGRPNTTRSTPSSQAAAFNSSRNSPRRST